MRRHKMGMVVHGGSLVVLPLVAGSWPTWLVVLIAVGNTAGLITNILELRGVL